MSDGKLELLLGQAPALDGNVWLDSHPDKDMAYAMAAQYADLLASLRLAGRYGVFTKRLCNRAGWAIFVGLQGKREGS